MSSSSSPGSSPGKKNRRIQPGVVVTAPYGQLDNSADPNPSTLRKRRSRARIRGAILRSHSENNWLVHWFVIGKTAHVSFAKLQIEANEAPLTESHIDALLKDNSTNYIGGVDELRDYMDNYYTKDVHQKKKEQSHPCRRQPKDRLQFFHVPPPPLPLLPQPQPTRPLLLQEEVRVKDQNLKWFYNHYRISSFPFLLPLPTTGHTTTIAGLPAAASVAVTPPQPPMVTSPYAAAQRVYPPPPTIMKTTIPNMILSQVLMIAGVL